MRVHLVIKQDVQGNFKAIIKMIDLENGRTVSREMFSEVFASNKVHEMLDYTKRFNVESTSLKQALETMRVEGKDTAEFSERGSLIDITFSGYAN